MKNETKEKIEANIKLALYGANCTQDYAEQQTKELLKIIQKHTTDNAVLKEVLKKHLIAEYEGAVAIDPSYYKILEELGMDDLE